MVKVKVYSWLWFYSVKYNIGREDSLWFSMKSRYFTRTSLLFFESKQSNIEQDIAGKKTNIWFWFFCNQIFFQKKLKKFFFLNVLLVLLKVKGSIYCPCWTQYFNLLSCFVILLYLLSINSYIIEFSKMNF